RAVSLGIGVRNALFVGRDFRNCRFSTAPREPVPRPGQIVVGDLPRRLGFDYLPRGLGPTWFRMVVAVHTRLTFPRNHVCKRRESGISEEAIMPLIQVQVIEEVFTPAQKREIVRELTDAMVSIEGESMRPVTLVVIQEVKSGDWAMGGKP